jgi:hypothetical protein
LIHVDTFLETVDAPNFHEAALLASEMKRHAV